MRKWLLVAVAILILSTQIVGCSSIMSMVKGDELTTMKEKLKLGMSKEEVKEQFGRAYTSIDNLEEDGEIWRFDTLVDEGYIVPQEEAQGAGVMYDRSGLLTGKLSTQLFINWTEKHVVKNAIVYYVSEGAIHEYLWSK